MSLLAQEVQFAVTSKVGGRVEDALEAAKAELSSLEGRQAAFLDGAKAVDALSASVDKDVEEGKYDLEVSAHIKRYLGRGSNALQNLAAHAVNARIQQQGRIQGLNHTFELLKGMADAAKAQAQAIRAAEAAPPPENPRERIEGVRPPMSIKEQRLAEEAAEQAAAAEASGSEAAPEAPEAEAEAEAEAPPKRRGGRKPRGRNS
jgi:hypothetical protein